MWNSNKEHVHDIFGILENDQVYFKEGTFQQNGVRKPPYTLQSRAFSISVSDLPIPTAISTRALEIASLDPSCINSGVIGIPSFCAIPLTLSMFGLALKAEVSLWRLY